MADGESPIVPLPLSPVPGSLLAQQAALNAAFTQAAQEFARQFRRDLERFARVMSSAGTSMADLRARLIVPSTSPRPFLGPALDSVADEARDAMLAALERKRHGQRGPERRHRGRARLRGTR